MDEQDYAPIMWFYTAPKTITTTFFFNLVRWEQEHSAAFVAKKDYVNVVTGLAKWPIYIVGFSSDFFSPYINLKKSRVIGTLHYSYKIPFK